MKSIVEQANTWLLSGLEHERFQYVTLSVSVRGKFKRRIVVKCDPSQSNSLSWISQEGTVIIDMSGQDQMKIYEACTVSP